MFAPENECWNMKFPFAEGLSIPFLHKYSLKNLFLHPFVDDGSEFLAKALCEKRFNGNFQCASTSTSCSFVGGHFCKKQWPILIEFTLPPIIMEVEMGPSNMGSFHLG